MDNIPYTGLQMIYGLVQCTGDTSLADCKQCLDSTMSKIPWTCDNSSGCEIATGSCRVVYDTQLFYDTSPQSNSPHPPNSNPPSNGYGGEEIDSKISLVFDLDIIRAATNNFSDSNKLGEEGMGQLSDGKEIAVKWLSRNSWQGSTEFENEVKLVAKLQHRNLAHLLGCCFEAEEKILIYEYVPNRSLDKLLFDPVRKTHLDWQIQSKIISGVARGLLYLHEDSQLKIIHGDLKASNILLDQDMTAKISNFGMAKLVGVEETQGKTSKVAGTYWSLENINKGKRKRSSKIGGCNRRSGSSESGSQFCWGVPEHEKTSSFEPAKIVGVIEDNGGDLYRPMTLINCSFHSVGAVVGLVADGAESAKTGPKQNKSSKGLVFSTIRPNLVIEASKATDVVTFYKVAFGPEEVERSNYLKWKAE
ncbi:cysteine-rich receptor-like protein kinase 10 [Nymphaea colorata]|uniref:cysteine-rich receptor-like protein kinase 10 n=1 Tax=Nymphaea colorata TaxID=210225 RepID=UPI00214E729C|nr:cysteine-rich receptor-like protein kinase 10 [Nymphaea colorata]